MPKKNPFVKGRVNPNAKKGAFAVVKKKPRVAIGEDKVIQVRGHVDKTKLAFKGIEVEHPAPVEIIGVNPFDSTQIRLLEIDSYKHVEIGFDESRAKDANLKDKVLTSFKVAFNGKNLVVKSKVAKEKDTGFFIQLKVGETEVPVQIPGGELLQEYIDNATKEKFVALELVLSVDEQTNPGYLVYKIPLDVVEKFRGKNFTKYSAQRTKLMTKEKGFWYKESFEQVKWYKAFFNDKFDSKTTMKTRIEALVGEMVISLTRKGLTKKDQAHLFNHCLEYLNTYDPTGTWNPISEEIIYYYLDEGRKANLETGRYTFFGLVSEHADEKRLKQFRKFVKAAIGSKLKLETEFILRKHKGSDGTMFRTDPKVFAKLKTRIVRALNMIRSSEKLNPKYAAPLYEQAICDSVETLLVHCKTSSGKALWGENSFYFPMLVALVSVIAEDHPLFGIMFIHYLVKYRDEYMKYVKENKAGYSFKNDFVYRYLLSISMFCDAGFIKKVGKGLSDISRLLGYGDLLGELTYNGRHFTKFFKKFDTWFPTITDSTLKCDVLKSVDSFLTAAGAIQYTVNGDANWIPEFDAKMTKNLSFTTDSDDNNIGWMYHKFANPQNEPHLSIGAEDTYSSIAIAAYQFTVFAERYFHKNNRLLTKNKEIYDELCDIKVIDKAEGVAKQMKSDKILGIADLLTNLIPWGQLLKAAKKVKHLTNAVKAVKIANSARGHLGTFSSMMKMVNENVKEYEARMEMYTMAAETASFLNLNDWWIDGTVYHARGLYTISFRKHIMHAKGSNALERWWNHVKRSIGTSTFWSEGSFTYKSPVEINVTFFIKPPDSLAEITKLMAKTPPCPAPSSDLQLISVEIIKSGGKFGKKVVRYAPQDPKSFYDKQFMK